MAEDPAGLQIRPLGPDDDPDFLRDLDRKRRRRKPEDPDPSSS